MSVSTSPKTGMRSRPIAPGVLEQHLAAIGYTDSESATEGSDEH
jgi:hypothetical protein